jgi:2-C-methyl-D-erythritol 4-phosphate cytidylyltransferase
MGAIGAIIIGAGRGERMGGVDKVFVPLGGRPLLTYSLDAFQESPLIDRIVLVLGPANLALGQALVAEGRWDKVGAIILGGARRQDSVRAGVAALDGCAFVAVHDAARPFLTVDLIARGIAAARAHGAAIAAMPVKETIKLVGADGLIRHTPPREHLWAAQTPQIATHAALTRALALADEEGRTVTDEAAAIEAQGEPVAVFPGAYTNIKVTTSEDLLLATAILEAETWR